MGTIFKHSGKVAPTVALFCFLGAVTFESMGADKAKPATPPPAQAQAPAKASGIKFRAPATGAPAVRVTGGSRGEGDAAVTLDVLAPIEVGTTTLEQPSLFWRQSKASPAKFELTVIQEKRIKPLLRMTLDSASRTGIQRVKLSDFGTKLEPGVEYQWVVALINDSENRSRDLVASGSIKRIAAGAELKEKIARANPAALPAVYAEAGVWYDALAALADQIEANPNDQALRQMRADLLMQVGLKDSSQSEPAAR
jgi:hypothetical protein